MKAYKVFAVLLLLLCFTGIKALRSTAKVPDTTDYLKASTALNKQLTEGIRNPELYNQLGLSYYHQGKTGMATVNFLRALRLNSAAKSARNNLEFAITHSQDRELYPEESFLSTFFSKIFEALNLNFLAVIMLVLLILLAACLHWLMHLPYSAEKAIPIMWTLICGMFFLVFSAMTIFKFQGYVNKNQAVVVEAEVSGYSGPGTEYAKTFTIHDGLILHISRQDKDWFLVTLPNGAAGWIMTSVLEKVKMD